MAIYRVLHGERNKVIDGLRLDAALEFFVQWLDRVRRAHAFPLIGRQTQEGKEIVADVFDTFRDRRVLELLFGNELQALLHLRRPPFGPAFERRVLQ
jgi:hypothetical protein